MISIACLIGRCIQALACVTLCSLLLPDSAAAAEKKGKPEKVAPTADAYLGQAQAAYSKGDRPQALSLINKAIQTDLENPAPYFARAQYHRGQGDSIKAIEDFDKVLKLNPAAVDVYHLRGVEHFYQGHIADAVNDFNQYILLAPREAPNHWQRGIALYYADKFAEGRLQFEQHQTVNSQDVENAAWHYFCVARADGPEKARSLLLPIASDGRVPMMEIHALLSGAGSPEAVLEAAVANNPSPATRNRQLFYAHLYLGLYYEVNKDPARADENIQKAIPLVAKDDYMGRVALVHAKIRKAAKKK